MPEQYGRKYKMIVGHNAIMIRDHDIEFNIVQTTTREPNSAEVTVFNLSPKTAKSVIESELPPFTFYAGYEKTMSMLFIGDARDCYGQKSGADFMLHINSGDKEKTIRTKRINKTYRKGTAVQKVLSDLIQILELQPGNIGSKYSALKLIEGSNQYVNGFVASGNAATVLNTVCQSVGLHYSIQNGELLVLGLNDALLEKPTILADTIIDDAEIGSDNTIRAKVLLNPEIKPGRLVSLGGKLLRVDMVNHYGKSAPAQSWYSEFEGRLI